MANIILPPCSGGRSSVCSIAETGKAATYQSNKFQVENFTQATVLIVTTNSSGTSPTLDVYIQKLLPDGATWHDIAAFTQITGNASRVMSLVSGGNKEEAQQSAALAAGTVNAVAFGGWWRIYYKIGGTSPSFDIQTAIEGLA